MKLYVLFGQRKCSYPGQYAEEALSCADENCQSDNPEYLKGEYETYLKSGEFDSLKIITLSISGDAVRRALFPELQEIAASVVEAD